MSKASTSARLGVVSPRKLPVSYRIGLISAAAVMLLLPTVYVAFIALVVAGVGLWTVFGVGLLATGFPGFLAYVVPAGAGGILVVFMLKPLFLRPPRRDGPTKIDPESQPRLADFVAEVSRTVGVPMPAELRVDCNVNASASFQRGWLGILRGRLVLTIGLPLAADLQSDELAAVIAHEFGHFAQRGAMGASFVVNSINLWFARVVYQRDRWDQWIEVQSRRRGFIIKLTAQLAKAGVVAGRRLLLVLMKAGHAVSCYLLRQMEYDADYYAVQALGTEVHLRATDRIVLLSVAEQRARADLSAMWREKRLVDNLPALVVERRSRLMPDVGERLRAAAQEQKGKWSDTHPTRVERERRSRQMNAAGILRFDGAARELFDGFDELCRDATWQHYGVSSDMGIDRNALWPVAQATRLGDQRQREADALASLAPGLVDCRRPVLYSPRDGTGIELKQQLASKRLWLKEHQKNDAEALAEYGRHALAEDNANAARAFIDAGLKVRPGSFDLIDSTAAAVRLKLDSARRGMMDAVDRISPADEALASWLGAGVGYGRLVTSAKVEGRDADAARSLLAADGVYRAAESLWKSLPEMRTLHFVFHTFCINAPALGPLLSFRASLAKQREQLDELIDSNLASTAHLSLPEEMAGRPMRLGEYVDLNVRSSDGNVRAQARASALYELQLRLIGHMAACIEVLERLPPFASQ